MDFFDSPSKIWMCCYLSVGPGEAGDQFPIISFNRFEGPWTLVDEIEVAFMEKIRVDELP